MTPASTAATSFGNTGADRGAQNSLIEENFFDNNGSEGVFFSASQAAGTISTNVLFHNSMTPANKTAVTYNGTETIDARGNWWASVNGPTSPANGYNVGSQGSTIGGTGAAHVLIAPWLTDGTDTQPATRGFQPNTGSSFAPITNDQGGFFSTFQAANNGTTAGGTITASNGSYNESNILIDRGVTIQGQSRAGVILGPAIADGHVNDNFTSASNGFLVGSSNVTIRTMTIDGNADGAIAGTQNYRNAILTNYNVGDYGNVDVDNVTISNIFRKGIGFYVVDNNKVTGDSVTNSSLDHIGGTGVTFEATFAIAAFQSDTDISNVQITTSAGGIGTNYFTTDADSPLVHISNTTVSNMTGLAGIPVIGMDLSGLADGSSVTGGSVDVSTGSTQADRGIVVQYTATNADVTVSGVTVTTGGGSDSDTGIMVYQAQQAAHPVLITGNTLVGNGAAIGVDVTDDGSFFGETPHVGITYAKLVNNNISGFSNGGGVVVEATTGTANAIVGMAGAGNGNTITGSTPGVYVTSAGASATVTNNNITSDSDGIDVLDGASATVTGNTINANAQGVDVAGVATSATINGNNSITAGINGVAVDATASATVDGNTITGTVGSQDGVQVIAGSSANVLNNTISGFDVGVEVVDTGSTADIGGGNNITAVTVRDGASFLGANYQQSIWAHIPAGVTAANANDYLHAYNDVYSNDEVVVNKTMTLEGAQNGVDPTTGGRTTPADEAIVRGRINGGNRTTAFNITANDVVIDGFTVRDTTDANHFGPAILMNVGTHGTRITNNIITNNVWGISLANNSSTDATRIDHNYIHDNNLAGPNSGQGIYADQFTAGANFQNVSIDHNNVAEPTGNAVDFSGSGAGWANNITVDNNTLSSDGTVVYSQDMSNFTVTNNTITVGTFRGIAVFDGGAGGGSDLNISNNTITANAANLTGNRHMIQLEVNGGTNTVSNNAVTLTGTLSATTTTGGISVTSTNNTGTVNLANNNVQGGGALGGTTDGVSVSNVALLNYTDNILAGWGSGGSITNVPKVNYTASASGNDTFVLTATTMQDNANQSLTYSGTTTLDVYTLAGDDTVTVQGAAAGLTTWVDAGTGTGDTVNWEGTAGADSVNFITAPTVGPDISATEAVYYTSGAQRVNIANSETRRIRTFAGDDTITYVRLGGSIATGFVIESGDDNDNVTGGLGNDTVFGGNGNDRMDGSTGNDSVDGQNGDDTLFGGVGNDVLVAGAGQNQLFGQNGNDTFFCQQGTLDLIDRGAGFDTANADAIDLKQNVEASF